MASASILTTSQTGALTAPAPVWFEATDLSGFNVSDGPTAGETYDPSFHDITYIWTVRDNPLVPWSKVTNMVSGWNNPNVAYGKRVAFCFPDPGTYVIDLWAIDSNGTQATATTSVDVVSPESFYSAANTIAFAQDGDFTGAPAANTQVTSLSALQSAIVSTNAATRITFKPGEVLDDFSLSSGGGHMCHIDTWTTGSPVEINVAQTGGSSAFYFHRSAGGSRITFRDIIARGGWDPRTETGIEAQFLDWNIRDTGFMAVIYGCEFYGMGYTLSLSCGQIHQVMIANTRIRDWKHYGIYSYYNGGDNSTVAAGGRYALIGVEGAQDPWALAGGLKTNLANDHGPVRLERAEEIYIAGCDFFSCTGWSGGPPRAANACLRLNSKGFDDTKIIIERTVLEGGYIQLKYDGENSTAPDFPNNCLTDRLLMLGTARSIGFGGVHFGGTTMRNVLAVMPDVPLYGNATYPYSFFQISPENSQPGNQDAPMRWYNNTLVNLQSGASTTFFFSNGASLWNDFTEENNLYIPSATHPDIGLIDTSTPLPGITPRFAQVRWNYVLEQGSVGSVPPGGTISIPYSSITRQDEVGNGPGGTTTQSYWQAAEAAGDTLHMINFGPRTYYAALGEMSVSFANATNIVITNTSNATWSGSYHLRLDRKSYLDTELPAETQYASPATIPTCAPLSAPEAQTTLGYVAHSDFFGTVRSQPVSPGAIEHT